MSIEKQLFLHYSQAEKALSKARNNNYSDKRKQAYQQSLLSLLNGISSKIKSSSTFTEAQVWQFNLELHFIFKNLEFLDSSILNLIPFEIVKCLEKALSDWTPSGQKYIVVTSLVNDINGFSFDPGLLDLEKLLDRLNNTYGVKFEDRLVHINIPKALSRDYIISGGILYHELGHFVDSKYSITHAIAMQLQNDIVYGRTTLASQAGLIQFIPSIKEMFAGSVQALMECYYHLGEYFSDLFAAQYVGDCYGEYLYYSTNGQGGGPTHPSTPYRNQVVKDFLSGTQNAVVDLINTAMDVIVGKKLTIMYEEIDERDIFSFLPPVIENDKQLHGIFAAGNRAWNADWHIYSKTMKLGSPPQPEKLYTIINNLVEKAIGNYIVVEKWKQIRP